MRVLVLWRRGNLECRNTIVDHALSFQRYDKENEYFYFDIYNGRFAEDYAWIEEGMFDAVIFHYSALAIRHFPNYWKDFAILMKNVWKEKECIKIFLTQDDYTYTESIWNLARDIDVKKIFTVMRPEDYNIIYPQDKIGDIGIENILTGYVETSYIKRIKLQCHKERKYDVVYRARQLPYDYGKQGQLKYELVGLFANNLNKTDLLVDIENTNGDKKALLGDGWFDFLASSRTTIGCLGGAGFMDATGSIKEKVAKYKEINPKATYEEARKSCFSECSENLHGVVSPRIFESALTKTCQILVGEDYQGILKPNVDYIVLKPDFSNINEVIEMMKDIKFCEQIAETCYKNVIESEKYTYKVFVDCVVQDMRKYVRERERSDKISKIIEEKCRINNKKVHRDMRIMDEKYKDVRR